MKLSRSISTLCERAWTWYSYIHIYTHTYIHTHIHTHTRRADGASEDDLDALLESMDIDRGVRICGMPGCKTTNLDVLGRICMHCKFKYCLNHALPEVHGCGKDASASARADWGRNLAREGQRNSLMQVCVCVVFFGLQ